MTVRRPGITHTDVLLVRPFEHALALIIAITAGLRLIGYGPIVAVLSPAVGAAWAFLGFVSAAFVVAGLHWRRNLIVGRAIEQGGWTAAAALLILGPLVVIPMTPLPAALAVAGFVDDFVLGLAALARLGFLHREAKAERKVYDDAVCRREE